ncbi:G2/mitotic-specific cyclin-B3 [Rhagoletis pomonella]|uniref:G2/mitotic-specific cyclin-B3 n=1 Tax=Rhagoletis pomonella TaxID=28610 RepID=UPI00177B2CEF|nr:G2/mitotic-specific cyclin-B3 [Rhagoletis pomonella]XP_036322879.1 G2/mitotic-specific cyclin-B3 [Rhagoletis pomonella]
MAPTKNTRAVSKQAATSKMTTLLPLTRKGLSQRSAINVQNQNVDIIQTRGKRKAEHSPAKNDKIKRSALGNLTNNVKLMTMTKNTENSDGDIKQNQLFSKRKEIHITESQAHVLKETQNTIGSDDVSSRQIAQKKIATRASTRNANTTNTTNASILEESYKLALSNVNVLTTAPTAKLRKSEKATILPPLPAAPILVAVPTKLSQSNKPVRRISNEFNKTEESLYMSALEDISSSESMRLSGNFEAAKRMSALILQEKNKTEGITVEETGDKPPPATVPEGVEDFDKTNWNDIFQVSHYAMDIFNYMKSREVEFPIIDYMEKQIHLTKWMRTLLVDWMVEVQETFELNHETLYLAVKIVDLFLCRVVINKDVLQLLGAAALFIACKFDERTPPLIEDFLYICDGAYKHDELIHMEMTTLRTINYDLGIPLSYRFLRRYARCAKVSMPTLTLARYILELSLMDYATIQFSDSKLACAALFIALRLHGDKKPWTRTLEFYSGYILTDFGEIVPVLNVGLHRKPKVKTIRSKYSHKIFHEVAKVSLLTTEQLFEDNLDLNTSIKIEDVKNS